jgi:transcription termination/antitermination protein NusA
VDTTFNLKHTIDAIVKEKGIDKQVILEALEQAVLSAANKKFRNTRDLEARYNEDIGEVELFEFVTVVDEVTDSYKEIDLEEAREVDPDVEVGDSLGMKMDASDFPVLPPRRQSRLLSRKSVKPNGKPSITNLSAARVNW